MRQFPDCLDVLDHADLVIHVHDRNQDGFGSDSCFKLFQIDQAIGFRIQVGYLVTFTLQMAASIQHSFVFGFTGDDVVALFSIEVGHTLYGEVIRFGRTRSPDYFFRIGADEISNIFPCFFYRFVVISGGNVDFEVLCGL